MKHTFLFVTLLLLPFIAFPQSHEGFLSDIDGNPQAEWTTLRANNNRDGRILSTGQFKRSATLKEAIDYSVSEAYIELSPGDANSTVRYRLGEVGTAERLHSLTTEWQTGMDPYLDVDGNGKITSVSVEQNVKYARLYEGDKRFYRIEAHDGFSVTGNVNEPPFVGIRVYEGSSDKLVFETKFPEGDLMQRPHITVADMNNDGRNDIVITSWEGIYVFDNRGKRIGGLSQDVEGWHHLRKRGFACLADVDGNGYRDVVIISSLPWHLDVVKNNGGQLEFGWTRIFDGLVESAKKISKPILNSVNDFDGDGKYEILVNVFNFNDDNNWSGVIFDASSGEVRAQIRGAYVLSAEDLNENGKYVFFCTTTQGQAVPLAAALKGVTYDKGRIQEILHIDKGEWINPRRGNAIPTVTTHGDGVSRLAEDVVLCVDFENIGRKAFFLKIKAPDGGTSIVGYYVSPEGGVKKTALSISVPEGMYGEIINSKKNADGRRSLLVQVRAFGAPEGTISISHARAVNRGRYVGANSKVHIPVVADIDRDGTAEVMVPNDVGEVLCFGRDRKGKMSLRWKVPGRGMTWQYASVLDYGISTEDLNHDGFKEIIVSGADEVGSVIAVYDHEGRLSWKTSFPEINGAEITGWDGNIAFYGTVQSSERKERDIIVTVQRGIAHGGKTYCLSGKDGRVLWQLDRLEADRGPGQDPIDSGAGGYVFSTFDIDGDGSDEVMCGFGNIVFFADSNDGTVKFKKFMRKVFTDKFDYPAAGYSSFWMQQILPVAFPYHDGLLLSCFNTAVAAGTMKTDGQLAWCPEKLNYGDRYWQCMANLDGDGKLWVVELSTYNPDGKPVLFAYDPVTGAMHENFRMQMPDFIPTLASNIMPSACDMNGDGRDEIVVSNADSVVCVGYSGNRPEVMWRYAAPGCGPAVIADADSDGYVEVVVATDDGRILILDN